MDISLKSILCSNNKNNNNSNNNFYSLLGHNTGYIHVLCANSGR